MNLQISKFLIVLTLALTLVNVQAKQKLCHALALSGGGNKGAYEAGVIYGMAHLLPKEEVMWDVVSGVSAGAMNTGGTSIFAVGSELEMSEWLVHFWGNLTEKVILKEWPEGLFRAIFKESGVFDDSPLFELLTTVFQQAPNGIQRNFIVSTVDTKTGGYRVFDETSPFEDLATIFISSASIPFIFPTRPYKDDILMDGGTVWNTNIGTAISKCMELVDHHSQIVLDAAICSHSQIDTVEKTGNTISNILRYRQIRHYYKVMDDILEQQRAFPQVNFRYTFIPSEELKGGINEIMFTQEHIQPMIELGKSDAAKVIKMGHGKVTEKYEQWKTQANLKAKFPSFHQYLYQ